MRHVRALGGRKGTYGLLLWVAGLALRGAIAVAMSVSIVQCTIRCDERLLRVLGSALLASVILIRGHCCGGSAGRGESVGRAIVAVGKMLTHVDGMRYSRVRCEVQTGRRL
jgi:hypothetical protein